VLACATWWYARLWRRPELLKPGTYWYRLHVSWVRGLNPARWKEGSFGELTLDEIWFIALYGVLIGGLALVGLVVSLVLFVMAWIS
jgi:hypothetical protein